MLKFLMLISLCLSQNKSLFGEDRLILSCQKGSLMSVNSLPAKSYHMTSLLRLRLCEKQFQVIYTTAIPPLKKALIFSVFSLMRNNYNANTNIL